MRAGPWERGLDVVTPERAPEPMDPVAESGTMRLPYLPDLPHLPDLGNLPYLPDLPHLPDLGNLPHLPDLGDLPDLPDLAGLPLEELLDAHHPVLARAARRVLDRLAAEEAPLAAYDSSAVPADDTSV